MEPIEIEEEYLTRRQAARLLGVSEMTFYRRAKDGTIPEPVAIWGGLRYRRKALEGIDVKKSRGRPPK